MKTPSLLDLIDQSLVLSDAKKRLLKKQIPFWPSGEQEKLQDYLYKEAELVGESIKTAENLPEEALKDIHLAIKQSKKNLNHCEESIEQEDAEKALEKSISTLQ